MILASADLIDHVMDHAWPGWQVNIGPIRLTLMSSGIATMILVATILLIVIPLAARRRPGVPHGGHNLMEALVVFVRDMIAAPALGDRKDRYLSLLLTLFVFVLGMNLMGLVLPLEPLSRAAAGAMGLHGYAVGGPTTSVPMICAALACVALAAVIAGGLRSAAEHARHERHWPTGLCWIASPYLWVIGLSPKVPGMAGRLLAWPLALLELVGAAVKCSALMIRLFANMISGHLLLALLLMLSLQVAASVLEGKAGLAGVAIVPILGGVVICLLELLVAVLQAYIFTFLTAMYLGLYSTGEH